MYTPAQVFRGLASPRAGLTEINRLFHRRFNTWEYNRRGVDVFAEDWDNLVILDACRYDLFERDNQLPGRLEHRISRGAATKEFLVANFGDRDLSDTVYVTANPVLYRNRHAVSPELHAWIDVWREDGWDREYKTVRPETMVEYGRRAVDRYPDKRLVVHFIQPHYPFIGPIGQNHFDLDSLTCPVWVHLGSDDADVSVETIQAAYEENFQLVLPHVARLLESLPGKTVVTADHGQLIGERISPVPVKTYGHPTGIYVDELVKVPWLVTEAGQRRSITSGDVAELDTTVRESTVRDRLTHLGYVE